MSRFILLFFPVVLSAQLISFGVKGGVPANDAFETARTANLSYLSDTKCHLVGGSAELWLPVGLGVNFDAVRPFVVGGPSFRALSDVRQFITDPLGNRETDDPAELSNRANTGLTVGAGIELGENFRVTPEIRYTRWGWENFQSPALPQFRNNQNQVDVLVGINF